MPELSRFYGIVIRMYFNDTGQHSLPHFHVSYADAEAVYLLDGTLIDGELPPKQDKLVVAWAALHEQELEENWRLATTTGECYRIAPLR